MVVVTCCPKAAPDSHGASPDEPLVHLLVHHGGHELVARVVVDFGAVGADNVIFGMDFWETAGITLDLRHHRITVGRILNSE